MWKIETISYYQLSELLRTSKPLGLFLFEHMDGYIAVDNTTGETWMEEFETMDAAIEWLNRPNFTRDDIVRDDDYAEA